MNQKKEKNDTHREQEKKEVRTVPCIILFLQLFISLKLVPNKKLKVIYEFN